MKYLIAILLLVSGQSWASDIKIISYGPKSGPTTNLGTLVSKELTSNPNVIATGDCQEAARQFNSEKSVIGVIGHASVVKGQTVGKKCCSHRILQRMPHEESQRTINCNFSDQYSGCFPIKEIC